MEQVGTTEAIHQPRAETVEVAVDMARGVTEMEEDVEDEVVVAMALAKECRIRLRS